MTKNSSWFLFSENWHMTVTMLLGSFIAGATSEGGGAVAFPVMTLGFNTTPIVARDFSLMIQSVGMSAASIMIVLARVPVEWRAVLFSGVGGVVGVIVSIEMIAGSLPPAIVKMFFVSFWAGFGTALYLINRAEENVRTNYITNFSMPAAFLLFVTGVAGGVVSGMTGTGLDILTFSVLVLYFGVCEKVATPTSVVLMASNSLAGFGWSEIFGAGVHQTAWDFWWVCVPVVVVGAPLGAMFIKERSRRFVVKFLYFSIVAQYAWATTVLPLDWELIAFSVVVVISSMTLFGLISIHGRNSVS